MVAAQVIRHTTNDHGLGNVGHLPASTSCCTGHRFTNTARIEHPLLASAYPRARKDAIAGFKVIRRASQKLSIGNPILVTALNLRHRLRQRRGHRQAEPTRRPADYARLPRK